MKKGNSDNLQVQSEAKAGLAGSRHFFERDNRSSKELQVEIDFLREEVRRLEQEVWVLELEKCGK